ncbi:hypothetical protein SDC9_58964 [bioreactor metagenome]|uniref:Uncharacterized protein n=1 Tax=bioreactor metagenome TaxID=1076179 RepID=A0A644X8W8_9ZZZZ
MICLETSEDISSFDSAETPVASKTNTIATTPATNAVILRTIAPLKIGCPVLTEYFKYFIKNLYQKGGNLAYLILFNFYYQNYADQ